MNNPEQTMNLVSAGKSVVYVLISVFLGSLLFTEKHYLEALRRQRSEVRILSGAPFGFIGYVITNFWKSLL